ncbi:uncharacterized protein A4U43_C05F22630 [Asparagus officinalis]|uniref:Peptidase S49 domain-containing protein n=1 Tax=Asparagus officinalis TaxID=4686 RepID=A0A5P1ETX0_ASPOF|nr:uncharacterized protein A4U43_C05F22630 [Asparagus officinalis]
MSKILLLKPTNGLSSLSQIRNLSSSLLVHRKPPLFFSYAQSLPLFSPGPHSLFTHHQTHNPNFPIRALNSPPTKEEEESNEEKDKAQEGGDGALPTSGSKFVKDDEYPSGEFEMIKFGWWLSFLVKLRMLVAFPWERVKKGSVLSIKLKGQISDQLGSRFSSVLSLPQICQNFTKAVYDPRVSGIYLQIEPLSCGWGKVEEIRRHILDFKKSGKFIVSYVPLCGEKEYYLACACGEVYMPPSAYVGLYGLAVQSSFLGGVLEKVGVEPQIQRLGKYKSAGDQLTRKSMSKEVCEMLTSLLDNIYGNWLDTVSLTREKGREEIENFLNTGVYQVERLKEEGWITDILYDDEVRTMLKERLGQKDKKNLLMVDYRKYSRVRSWTLGLEGGRDQIAIIRACGNITRARSPLSVPSSGIIADQLIEKIRSIRESDRYKAVKAVVLRIDSPGGDALASDFTTAVDFGTNMMRAKILKT